MQTIERIFVFLLMVFITAVVVYDFVLGLPSEMAKRFPQFCLFLIILLVFWLCFKVVGIEEKLNELRKEKKDE